jgi:multidrug resistance efflux pump
MYSVAILSVAAILAAQPARAVRAADKEETTLPHCVVSLIEGFAVPAQLPGVLMQVSAKEGDLVRKGDVLARVDDTEAKVKLKSAKAKLDEAREKASNDANVRSAKKIAEFYLAEYEAYLAINKKSPGTVSDSDLRKYFVQWESNVLKAEVEEMNFAVAGLEQKIAEIDVEAVQTDLERRTLRAPFDGVVVQRNRQQGEWVQPGDPVLKVIRMDRLRVEGFLPADKFAPERVEGARVTVKVKLAGGDQETLVGSVDFVSPMIEASGDYRFFAEIENRTGRGGYRWLVRPGADVELAIQLRKPGEARPRPLREQ